MDGRIRVLHVLQTISIGGMETRVLKLAKGLDPAVYDINAVSLRESPAVTLDWEAGKHTFFPIAPGLHWGRLLHLAQYIGRERFSIVHSHNWATMLYGILAGRLARVPVVLHGEHGANQDDWRGVSRKREIAAAMLARLATRVVVVNRFVGAESVRRWRLPESHVVSIPNGVDLARFVPHPRREGGEIVFGTVARFDPVKNLPFLIRVFARFRRTAAGAKAKLILVGGGPLFADLRALAANSGCADSIEFPGETQTPETWYPRFDVYLNTSVSEGMSNTILEAMACGLPVIASRVPGNACWLRMEENALFFESGDEGALIERLEIMASSSAVRSRMGEANRRLAESEYDNLHFIFRYNDLYQRLLRP
jgi:glycosyltransferase involved in cell wall biosynthesis